MAGPGGARNPPVPLQLLQVRRVPLGALEQRDGITGLPLQQPASPTPRPLGPSAHQVEVGEDAGGPVLLGHEQQHLVVDEVAVLLERASQAQLQGLADLRTAGGARLGCPARFPPFPVGPGDNGLSPPGRGAEARKEAKAGRPLGGEGPSSLPGPRRPAHLFGSDALQVTGLQHLPQLGPDRLLHLLLF